MKRFALSKPAERDLDQIKAYLLVEAGPAVTRKVLGELRDAHEVSWLAAGGGPPA